MLCHRKYSFRFVIDLFTRSQLLHSSELNRIIFETTSKEFRSSKAMKVSLLFKHQFRYRSYFWLSKQSQFWASLIKWTRFNKCSFIFECESCSFIAFEYHSLLSRLFSTHACEWRNFSRRFLRIESVSYFHRYSVFDDDLNRYLLKSFNSVSTANKSRFVVDITYRWASRRSYWFNIHV